MEDVEVGTLGKYKVYMDLDKIREISDLTLIEENKKLKQEIESLREGIIVNSVDLSNDVLTELTQLSSVKRLICLLENDSNLNEAQQILNSMKLSPSEYKKISTVMCLLSDRKNLDTMLSAIKEYIDIKTGKVDESEYVICAKNKLRDYHDD